jgi:Tol biopolymer transport system component
MHTPARVKRAIATLLAITTGMAGTIALPADPAGATVTTTPITARVSLDSLNGGHDGTVSPRVLPDATGRYVFFSSTQALGVQDNDFFEDVFRKDRLTGDVLEVSVAGKDTQVTGNSRLCGMSPNGNFVGFVSTGGNLPGTPLANLYLRNIQAGTTTLVSVATDGSHGLLAVPMSQPCGVSADGKTVAFTTASSNLAPNDSNAAADVFVRHLGAGATGTTERASVDSGGVEGLNPSTEAAISADGKVVAFSSTNSFVAGDANSGGDDVFVRVLAAKVTQRVSTKVNGTGGNSGSRAPSLSTDGRYVAFDSYANDLGGAVTDDNGFRDVFRKDRTTGLVAVASVAANDIISDKGAAGTSITGDGRYIGFASPSTNLYPISNNGKWNAFRHDFTAGHTDLVSRQSGSILPGDKDSNEAPAFSTNGQVAGFMTYAKNLAGTNDNDLADAYVHDFAFDITPFGSIKALVQQQYIDFNGGPGDPDLMAFFTTMIQQGFSSPEYFVLMGATGEGWSDKRAPLIRLYWAYFLRLPDLGGMNYWTNKLTNGMKLTKVAAEFAKSSEFQTKYGALSNKTFVTKIYENIFDREPDAAGLAFWTKQLDQHKKTRGDVMVNFSESSEGRRLLAPQSDTVLIYLGMLRVMPSKATFDAQVAARKAGHPVEEFISTLRHLPAYAARVTP